jgi:hypothetical protein
MQHDPEMQPVYRLGLWPLLLIGLALQACWVAGAPGPEPRDARTKARESEGGAPVSSVELQQSLQRFTGEFIDSVTQAMKALDDPKRPERQELALRRLLLYGSSSLDIASGPLPEVNMLDMIVFLSLSRHVLESYWVPKQLGPEAQPAVSAFEASEATLWSLSNRILSTSQQGQVHQLIRDWLSRHADQVDVEWVRFQDFALRSGAVAQERADDAQGMLGSLKSASQSADQAVRLAERALFLGNRMPFLLRLQARLGADEVLDDTAGRLQDLKGVAASASNLNPMLREAVELGNSSRAAIREMRLFYQELEPTLKSLKIAPGQEEAAEQAEQVTYRDLEQLLQSSNQLAEHSLALTKQLSVLLGPGSTEHLQQLGERVDGSLQRIAAYLVLIGAAWALFFWGGYYLAKRPTTRARPPADPNVRPSSSHHADRHSQP